ncbi:OmpA family protein [Leptospira yasudae]|uniref:OmpA family protein n=1 Tax=Leptospira yasudae TaxID=2202201 RepID=A0A6N4R0F1_9LEPT|nr:OmpA family protein [Leptospira yasudae]TGL77151.1 OmpA family protein [Leptospira yasudae]TGL80450.1 OmpA family protein [Leptospira yasudae]TGL85877.1 OmpA family protein [Leptospira yasudae]
MGKLPHRHSKSENFSGGFLSTTLRIAVLILFFDSLSLVAEEPEKILFRWKLVPGENVELNEYHRVQLVSQGRKIKREDKNRILLQTLSCENKACMLEGFFDTYTRFPEVDPAFRKDKTFKSRFQITELGQYRVPQEFSMPNLRSLPSFSEKPVSIGEEWTQPATESFQFPGGRVMITVLAKYKYHGIDQWEFQKLSGKGDRIEYNYTLFYDSQVNQEGVPFKIYGFARGMVFFDREQGLPQYKRVQLAYTFVYANGMAQEMSFDIHGVYNKNVKLTDNDKDKFAEEIHKILKNELPTGIESDGDRQKNGKKPPRDTLQWPEEEENRARPENEKPSGPPVEIRRTEEGIAISLNSVLFDYNSSELKEEAKKELERIASVLKKYGDREIRISGHTDNSGGEEYNRKLSRERALSVLKELRDKQGLEEKRMSYEGYGKSKPIADNSTIQGRQKNRRVDITIVME